MAGLPDTPGFTSDLDVTDLALLFISAAPLIGILAFGPPLVIAGFSIADAYHVPERHWSGPGGWDSQDRRAWTVGVGGLLLQLTVMAALVAA